MRPWLFLAIVLTACQPSPPLPVLGEVPAFELTAETGKSFSRKELDGRVWVADFVYTTCSGPCPLMSAKMQRLQASVPNVLLVSFSVDPERDTPDALAAYARRYHADPTRWFFLTGPRTTLQTLSKDAFKLSDITPDLTHSTRFVLIDRQGRIRGYYGTSDDSAIPKLLADIRRLQQEKS
jgi:protein SCO1/2